MTLLKTLPTDLENIILDYKYGMEYKENMDNCIKQINKIVYHIYPSQEPRTIESLRYVDISDYLIPKGDKIIYSYRTIRLRRRTKFKGKKGSLTITKQLGQYSDRFYDKVNKIEDK